MPRFYISGGTRPGPRLPRVDWRKRVTSSTNQRGLPALTEAQARMWGIGYGLTYALPADASLLHVELLGAVPAGFDLAPGFYDLPGNYTLGWAISHPGYYIGVYPHAVSGWAMAATVSNGSPHGATLLQYPDAILEVGRTYTLPTPVGAGQAPRQLVIRSYEV